MGVACCDSSQAPPDLRKLPKGGINRNNQDTLGGGMPGEMPMEGQMEGEEDGILSDEDKVLEEDMNPVKVQNIVEM